MGMYFSEYTVGQRFTSPRRTVTEADVVNFAGLSGDYNPLHTDAVFAEGTPFKQRVAHGMLSVAISTGLGQLLGIFEGTTLALMSITSNFKAPVFFGDTILLQLTVKEVKPSSKGGRGVVEFTSEIVNQRGEVVVDGGWTVMFRDR